MNDTSPDRTEQELREALAALADGVQPPPDAYRTARGEWLRRERRRRLVLAVLITVVFALATLIGLWVLNQTPSDPGVIFSGTGSPASASLPRPQP
jgi:ferric-dicitrate binding protein FerR (iron transport regulator)